MLPSPASHNYMKVDKRAVMRQVENMRKNPPRVLPQHHAEAKKLLDKNKAFYEAKDKDIARERKSVSREIADWTYNQIRGVGKVFHGFGEGKARTLICSFCGEHCSSQWYSVNGKWFGSEHKQFSELTGDELERERLCLLQKKTR